MRKLSIVLGFVLTIALRLDAHAQMMGGGNHHGNTPVTGRSNGMHGARGNMHGGGDPANATMSCPMAGGHGTDTGLTVASDGTLLLTRAGQLGRSQLLAIRGGVVQWEKDLPGAMLKMLISGERLITVTEWSKDNETARKTTVGAYALATGTMIWTASLDGTARAAASFNDGLYVVLGTADGEESMEEGHCDGRTEAESMMKSTVAAISSEGKVLWKMPLQ